MKKYQIIYADPPWRYEQNDSPETHFHGACRKHYPTMSIDDICKLRVDKIADKDCALFLWVTFPQLEGGLRVIKAWGFEYKTVAFNWIKLNKDGTPFLGIGFYTRSNSEICLLGAKGNIHKFVKDKSVNQVVITKRLRHSQKPSEVRNRIVQLMGDRPRIELFARKPKGLFEDTSFQGWDVWGNEVESDIDLTNI